MGGPGWSGSGTPEPGVRPSSQAFAAAARRLVALVRPQRLWPAGPAQPRIAHRPCQPTFGCSSSPILPSLRQPSFASHVR
ncbi:MAG: hypothetical protein ACK58T_22485, partial [Phycisphaerae bacterium]